MMLDGSLPFLLHLHQLFMLGFCSREKSEVYIAVAVVVVVTVVIILLLLEFVCFLLSFCGEKVGLLLMLLIFWLRFGSWLL